MQPFTVMGYADRPNVEPGRVLRFHVSSDRDEVYRADLVRVVCGDRAPGGAGFEEHEVPADFAGEYPGRRQHINAGSRAEVELTDEVTTPSGFTLSAMVFATTPGAGRQGLCGTWATDHAGQARGASLILQDGCPALIFAVDGRTEVVSSGIPVAAHRWQQVTLSHDPSAGSVTFVVGAPQGHPLESGPARVCTLLVPAIDGGGRLFTIAALRDDSDGPEGFADWAVAHFNGKLDRVRWLGAPAEPDVVAGPTPPADVEVLGWWDFGREIDSERIIDLGPAQRHGRTRNLPARAATGHNWDGSAHRWVDAPEQYGAIHFHTDDVHDAGWEPSFEYRVPDDLPSGVYAARLTNADGAYRIPFFVRAGAGQQRADIVFVASTATYLAYGNGVQTTELIHAALRDDRFLDEVYLTLKEHPEFGRSGYDIHADGTPRRHMSWLRPLVDVQPGVSKAWSFQADTLVLAWLERSGYSFDVVTDHDLAEVGAEALAGYCLVITGGHPEYFSTRMRDAYDDHLAAGGRLIYLGGNGFYMRVAFHPDLPGAMEMRRVQEQGLNLWHETAGDTHFAFTGEPAGLWQHLGRNPNLTVAVGMHGLKVGTELTFEPAEGTDDPRVGFVLEGVDGPIHNPYGEVYGMLASDEFDRVDVEAGSPPHAVVIASAGSASARADLTFCETPFGGAVFSTSCISWSLGLNRSERRNALSRITANVVDRFVDPEPFTPPQAASAE